MCPCPSLIKMCWTSGRTLAEFWHWFVANVPGTNVDDGQEIFQLLPPLVLPGAEGDHRYGVRLQGVPWLTTAMDIIKESLVH